MANDTPQLDKTPVACPACDAMVTLGLLTSVCETSNDPAQKGKCLDIIKPLEQGKISPAAALKDVIVMLGEGGINDVLDRMNLLLYQATDEAKRELISQGKLNSDGTRKDGQV